MNLFTAQNPGLIGKKRNKSLRKNKSVVRNSYKSDTGLVSVRTSRSVKISKLEFLYNSGINILQSGKNWFFGIPLFTKIIIILVLAGISWFAISKINSSKAQEVQYQTIVAEKGVLVTSVSASGTVSSGNRISITTKATGVVLNVFVSNGETVSKGQEIAEIILDEYALERQSNAWVSYLNASEAIKTAEKTKLDADIEMWEARQGILDAEEDIKYKDLNKINPDTKKEYTLTERTVIDKTLEQTRITFDLAESKYKNADDDIQNSRVKLAAAWRDYQEVSAVITAPTTGIVRNFVLTPGVIIESSTAGNSNTALNSTTESNTVTSQNIGKIENTTGQLQASVNLTEIDVINIEPNQKVSLTLDAYPDKTFTGKVLSIDTDGSANSGVTSYPVTILLDPTSVKIYSNMAINAQIITNIKNDIMLVPLSVVQTGSGQSIVQVIKEGKVSDVLVETGDSNDIQIEIISGINEGDLVVTSSTAADTGRNQSQSGTTTSPFSGLSGGRGFNNSGGNGTFRSSERIMIQGR